MCVPGFSVSGSSFEVTSGKGLSETLHGCCRNCWIVWWWSLGKKWCMLTSPDRGGESRRFRTNASDRQHGGTERLRKRWCWRTCDDCRETNETCAMDAGLRCGWASQIIYYWAAMSPLDLTLLCCLGGKGPTRRDEQRTPITRIDGVPAVGTRSTD